MNRARPVDVVGLASGVLAISAGWEHTCALTSSGGVKCWGSNSSGELGDGTRSDRATPVDVVGLTGGVASISAGFQQTCALTSSGRVKCWGFNGYAGLLEWNAPREVVELNTGVLAVSAGGEQTCALTGSAGVKCWGDNFYGGLGDGTKTDRGTPVDVIGLASGVQAISTGDSYACALTGGGGVKCWGWNSWGELGDGTNISRTAPVDVAGLGSNVLSISASGLFTCALMSYGGVKCWGEDRFGELGNGATADRATYVTPVDVIGLTSGALAISAGGEHTCALLDSGRVKCWGWNGSGQLGDGTTIDRTTPVDVVGLTNSAVAVSTSAGGYPGPLNETVTGATTTTAPAYP